MKVLQISSSERHSAAACAELSDRPDQLLQFKILMFRARVAFFPQQFAQRAITATALNARRRLIVSAG